MEIINSLFFYIIAGVAVLSAISVILAPRIIYSAIALIITFITIAGIFLLLNADFIGVSQVILYGVGVTIVLLFAIMLTVEKSNEKFSIAFAPRTIISLGFIFCLFCIITASVTNNFRQSSESTGFFKITKPSIELVQRINEEGTTGMIGNSLFTNYVLPFEVLSLLLLATILGAVVLAKKDDEQLTNPTTLCENKSNEEKI